LTGFRRGEIAGLRWSDIDLVAGTVNICNTRVSVDGEVVEKPTKSKAGTRTLQLPDELLAELKRTRKARAVERLAAGPAYDPACSDCGHEHVVANEVGQPPHPESVSTWWDSMLVRVGLPAIHLHDARHTCGTLLALDGVPMPLISAWLGHADTAFTARTYTHSQPVALAQMAATRTLNVR